MGESILHGPHQVAQKSISTGLSEFITSSLKVAPVKVITAILVLLLILIIIFRFIIKHTVAKTLKLRICNLLSEFFANALIVLRSLNSAWAIAACAL